MSLYNIVIGYNPNATWALSMMGFDKSNMDKLSRFRDAWIADDEKTIVILTRTGGGNRPDYVAENEFMESLPGFISGDDDECDPTFINFKYNIPERFLPYIPPIMVVMKVFGLTEEWYGPKGLLNRITKKPMVRKQLAKNDPLIDAAVTAITAIRDIAAGEIK